MCLAIPMKIVALSQEGAVCETRGVRRTVNLYLLQHQPIAIGDYLLVHVGFGIKHLTPDQALEIFNSLGDRHA